MYFYYKFFLGTWFNWNPTTAIELKNAETLKWLIHNEWWCGFSTNIRKVKGSCTNKTIKYLLT